MLLCGFAVDRLETLSLFIVRSILDLVRVHRELHLRDVGQVGDARAVHTGSGHGETQLEPLLVPVLFADPGDAFEPVGHGVIECEVEARLDFAEVSSRHEARRIDRGIGRIDVFQEKKILEGIVDLSVETEHFRVCVGDFEWCQQALLNLTLVQFGKNRADGCLPLYVGEFVLAVRGRHFLFPQLLNDCHPIVCVTSLNAVFQQRCDVEATLGRPLAVCDSAVAGNAVLAQSRYAIGKDGRIG